MASLPGEIVVRVTLSNVRALRALCVVEECLEAAAEGNEWDKDLGRALRAARYAMKNLTVASEGKE
jgi:hypothetical protein